VVCEKGGLQFVGLYEILTEKNTPATGGEGSDCVDYSNSRLHPVHRVGFCRLNHQPCESMKAVGTTRNLPTRRGWQVVDTCRVWLFKARCSEAHGCGEDTEGAVWISERVPHWRRQVVV